MPAVRDPRRVAFACRIHAERRALQRDCPVPVTRLEQLCLRMRPAFERPDRDRYRLTVKGGGLEAPGRLGPRARVHRHGLSGDGA